MDGRIKGWINRAKWNMFFLLKKKHIIERFIREESNERKKKVIPAIRDAEDFSRDPQEMKAERWSEV